MLYSIWLSPDGAFFPEVQGIDWRSHIRAQFCHLPPSLSAPSILIQMKLVFICTFCKWQRFPHTCITPLIYCVHSPTNVDIMMTLPLLF